MYKKSGDSLEIPLIFFEIFFEYFRLTLIAHSFHNGEHRQVHGDDDASD